MKERKMVISKKMADIYNTILEKQKAGEATQMDRELRCAIYDGAARGFDLGDSVMFTDHYEDTRLQKMVETLRAYKIEKIINASSWSGEMQRCYEMQEAGLRPGNLVRITSDEFWQSDIYGLEFFL